MSDPRFLVKPPSSSRTEFVKALRLPRFFFLVPTQNESIGISLIKQETGPHLEERNEDVGRRESEEDEGEEGGDATVEDSGADGEQGLLCLRPPVACQKDVLGNVAVPDSPSATR